MDPLITKRPRDEKLKSFPFQLKPGVMSAGEGPSSSGQMKARKSNHPRTAPHGPNAQTFHLFHYK